jgi:hypothetical protein
MVVGRATFVKGAPRVDAYVHKEVTSAAARLDHFLSRSGVGPDQRVTVISDDAGEFSNAVGASQLAQGRILDWFHIAMKFQAAQKSILVLLCHKRHFPRILILSMKTGDGDGEFG